MILLALFVGIVLIVAAVRNSQDTLFSALFEDVPAYVTWAAAIFAIGAIGFIPSLKPVSRGLLALVIIVLIVNNYKQILSGFQNVATPPKPTAANDNGAKAAPASAATGALNAISQNIFSSDGLAAIASDLGVVSA